MEENPCRFRWWEGWVCFVANFEFLFHIAQRKFYKCAWCKNCENCEWKLAKAAIRFNRNYLHYVNRSHSFQINIFEDWIKALNDNYSSADLSVFSRPSNIWTLHIICNPIFRRIFCENISDFQWKWKKIIRERNL